jgi:hypothetical protein
MNRTRTSAAIATFVAVSTAFAGASEPENAVLTFGFTDLNIDYDTTDGVTGTLNGTSQPNSAGDVTDVPTDTTTRFESGYADTKGLFDATFNFDVSNITDSTADGVGSFSIIDADGDEIAGLIDGAWTFDDTMNTMAFEGELSAVQVDTADGNAIFEGTEGESFDLSAPAFSDDLTGGLVQLSFAPEEFFDESFDGYNAAFSGVVVPAPGAMTLIGLGGLAAIRRRRA